MKIYIDADGCPVVKSTVKIAGEFQISCVIICDTSHRIELDGAETIVVSQGADSVDFRLVNMISAGDMVITQDYGLASMCLAKEAFVLHQDGWAYTQNNISGLMEQRHAAKKYRLAGGRTKGPSKRRPEQNEAFRQAFTQLLQQSVQG